MAAQLSPCGLGRPGIADDADDLGLPKISPKKFEIDRFGANLRDGDAAGFSAMVVMHFITSTALRAVDGHDAHDEVVFASSSAYLAT